MGTFFVKCKIEHIVDRSKSVVLPKMLADTGSETTWISATTLERFSIGCTADCLVCRKLSQSENIGRLDSLPYTDSQSALEKIGVSREKKDLEFLMANGQRITRSIGFASIRLNKYFTVDEVVLAEKGDLLLLGARTLEGLNLTVDSREKKLVVLGPILAA